MVRMCLHCGGGGGGRALEGAWGKGRLLGEMEAGPRNEAAGTVHAMAPVLRGLDYGSGGSGGAALASRRCAGAGNVVCDSLDCGVYFERRKLVHELATMAALTEEGCKSLDAQW